MSSRLVGCSPPHPCSRTLTGLSRFISFAALLLPPARRLSPPVVFSLARHRAAALLLAAAPQPAAYAHLVHHPLSAANCWPASPLLVGAPLARILGKMILQFLKMVLR